MEFDGESRGTVVVLLVIGTLYHVLGQCDIAKYQKILYFSIQCDLQ